MLVFVSPEIYKKFPNQNTRPHCDMCGPFASKWMRQVGKDEFGPIWRCEGCDNED